MTGMGFDYFSLLEPGVPALVDPSGKIWSRAELFALANRLSRALRAAGLEKGDTVAVLAPNCAEFLAAHLATTQAGLYLVPINWHLSPSEVAYILEDSGAAAVITHGRLAGAVLAAVKAATTGARAHICIRGADGYVAFEEFVAPHSGTPLRNPELGRVMMYTSATTGRPKGIQLPLPESRAALERTIRFHIDCGIELGQGQVHLCASMLYHAAPLEGAIIALHMGHLLVLVDRWQPEALLQLIDAYRVTTTMMVPTMFVRMLKLPENIRRRYSLASLQRVVHTGAPCPPEVKRQMIDWWGPVIWDTYGAAEGAGTVVSSEEWIKYPGTVGRPIPGSEIRILDDAGNVLPATKIGTIYLKRYTGDRFEYRGDPEKTRACHRGEFFTVGDVGYLNEAGYLFICDRKIDMIISGGMNIYSAEVERVLVTHPAVADCAVFGIPDALLGEVVRAVVQPLPGVEGTSALSTALMQFLGKHLAAAKLPKRIDYMSELPRDPSGKLYKRRLRQPYWEERSPSA